MREFIYSWGASLCLAGVATAILHLLLPETTSGRLVKLASAAIWLLCVLSPLLQVDWQAAVNGLPWPLSDTAQEGVLAARVIEQVQPALDKSVYEEGAKALASYGLHAKNIRAVMDIDEEGRIYISRIIAELDTGQAIRRADVRAVLQRRFEREVEIREVS